MPRILLVGGSGIAVLLLFCLSATAQDPSKPSPGSGPSPATGSQPRQTSGSEPTILGASFVPAPQAEQSPTVPGTEAPVPSQGLPPPADFGGPGGQPFSPFAATVGHMPMIRADYRASWFPNESVSGQSASLGFVRQDASFGLPIWQDDQNEWSASARGALGDFPHRCHFAEHRPALSQRSVEHRPRHHVSASVRQRLDRRRRPAASARRATSRSATGTS